MKLSKVALSLAVQSRSNDGENSPDEQTACNTPERDKESRKDIGMKAWITESIEDACGEEGKDGALERKERQEEVRAVE